MLAPHCCGQVLTQVRGICRKSFQDFKGKKYFNLKYRVSEFYLDWGYKYVSRVPYNPSLIRKSTSEASVPIDVFSVTLSG